jgi:hypothetical protein
MLSSNHAIPSPLANEPAKGQRGSLARNELLTVKEVAELLRVPISRVYDRTRNDRSTDFPEFALANTGVSEKAKSWPGSNRSEIVRMQLALIFATRQGTPLAAKNLRRRQLHPASQQAGLGLIDWHSLRHTWDTTSRARNSFASGASATRPFEYDDHAPDLHPPNQ